MDHFFKEHFRLNKPTLKLCDLLAPRLERQITQFRSHIPFQHRVAIGLRRLGTGDSFESLSLQFGFGVSSCHRICSEFEAILTDKTSDFIKFPANEQASKAKTQEFQEK